MDLAIESARGGLWLDRFQVTPGRVLYIDEESSLPLASVRLRKLLTAKGIPSESLDIQFVMGQGVLLSSHSSVKHLSALIDRHRPDVVILDSLVRLHRADENSATDMAKVFDTVKGLVRKFKCLFVFADHHRKPGPQESSGDSSLRGSSEKVAFVDTLLSLKKVRDHVLVEHSKSRFAQPVEPFEVALEEPVEGSVWIRVLGDHAAIRSAETKAKVMPFIQEVLNDGEWKSRRELVDLAQLRQIKERELDQVLREMVSETVEREDRRIEGRRGGKTAHFRLRDSFHVPPIYIGEKSETKSSGQGAA